MTKIDIISGFLGAGKTTLIKKLLKEAFQEEQVVLIENEFGEIGIDGGFLKEAGIQIREMNSGCICCSLVGDFGASLKEVISKYHPDRILIEPSGVGKLSDVIKAVQGVQEETGLVLNSYTTVVDAKKCKMYMRNFGEFFTDIVDEAKAAAAMELLRGINSKAAIITTPIANLDGKKILEVMEHPVSLEQEMLEEEVCPECGHIHEHGHHHHEEEHSHSHEEHEHHHDHECGCGEDHHHEEHEHHHDHECGCGEDHHHEEHEHHHDHECGCGHDHHHGHHHADEVFTSWGRETIKKYTKEKLEKILDTLSESEEYGTILRAKGMLPCEDGTWIYFDMVPEETEIRSGAPEYTGRLCVIGSKLNEEKLAELFEI